MAQHPSFWAILLFLPLHLSVSFSPRSLNPHLEAGGETQEAGEDEEVEEEVEEGRSSTGQRLH